MNEEIFVTKPWIFVHIQKTGGSSIRSALGAPLSPPEKHLFAKQLRNLHEMKAWQSSYKFAFVRNPWDRLVSWWSMIDTFRADFASGRPLNKFHTFVLEHANTFEEFLENCDEEIFDTDGEKWIYRNQLDYITDDHGKILVDFVGRFERLQCDFDTVVEKIEPKHMVSLPRINASKHRHYAEFYTPALIQVVTDRFARDIEAFGYKFGQV